MIWLRDKYRQKDRAGIHKFISPVAVPDTLVLLLCYHNSSGDERTLIGDGFVVVGIQTCTSTCQNGRRSPLNHFRLVGVDCLLQGLGFGARSGGGGWDGGQNVR